MSSIVPINSATIDQIIASLGDSGVFFFSERTPVSFFMQSITKSLFNYGGVYFRKLLDEGSQPEYQIIFLDYMTRQEVTPTWNSVAPKNSAYFTDMRTFLANSYLKWFKFFSVKEGLTGEFRLSTGFITKPPGRGKMTETDFIRFMLGVRSTNGTSEEGRLIHLSNSVEVLAEVAGDMKFRGVVGSTPGVRTLEADFNLSPDEVFNMFIGQEQTINNIVAESIVSADEPMTVVEPLVTDSIATGIQEALDPYYTALPAEGFPTTGTSPYTIPNSMIAKPETPSEVMMREFFWSLVQKRIIEPVRAINFPINSFLSLNDVLSEIFDDNGQVYFKVVEDSIPPLHGIVINDETRLESDKRFMGDFFRVLTELIFTPPTADADNENFIAGGIKGIIDVKYSDLLNDYVNTATMGMMVYQLSRNSAAIREYQAGGAPVDPDKIIAQNTYLISAGNNRTGYNAPV